MPADLQFDGKPGTANADLETALMALPSVNLRVIAASGASFEARYRAEGDRPMADLWRVISIAADDVLADRNRVLVDLERDVRPAGYRVDDDQGDDITVFPFPHPYDLTEDDGTSA